MITIKEGSVDFYDNKCTKRSYTAGQAFTEGSEPHNALNSGTGNAHLLVFYVIKKGESRRIENPQPPSAVRRGIPERAPPERNTQPPPVPHTTHEQDPST